MFDITPQTNQTTKEDAKRLDARLSDKLLNCFKSPNLAEQLKALRELEG